MKAYSKYDLKKETKITYLLGAGASYSSIPIWSEQGASMDQVADSITLAVNNPSAIFRKQLIESELYQGFTDDQESYLINLAEEIKLFAEKARINQTIDSYAFQLYKRKRFTQLDKLKKCLSIFLDIWQFYETTITVRKKEDAFPPVKEKVDMRYFKWLNMITESDENGYVRINEDVNILNWNYDLQIELGFANFYEDLQLQCLDDINNKMCFLNHNSKDIKPLSIHHLNGHHGYFKYDKKYYPTGRNLLNSTFYSYLIDLCDNLDQFKLKFEKVHDYRQIQFAWEKDLPKEVLEIASNTDILIVIGYSFPQYNRTIDRQLIDLIKENKALYIYYQDPVADVEDIKSFINYESFQHSRRKDEFYIPDQFINPKENEIVF